MSALMIVQAESLVVGLLAGSAMVWSAPRLVAHRLEEQPEFPSPTVAIPLAGVFITKYDLRRGLAVQIVTALTFAALSLHYGPSAKLLLSCLYSALFILIAYIDIEHRLVLNILTYPGLVVSLALSFAWPGMGPIHALLGGLTGLAVFLILQVAGRGRLGMGDTKLALLIGVVRSFPDVFNAILIGVLFGGIAAVVVLVARRGGRKQYIAYAPYLVAGAVVSFFFSA